MKIENTSARLYTLSNGLQLIPSTPENKVVTTVPDSLAKEVEGIKELKVTQETKAQDVVFQDIPTTKAELADWLKEKGVEHDASASKADLQALYEANK